MTAYLDLTHPISNGMPFYPGTPEPEISRLYTIEETGYAEINMKITSHTGTHIDAPAHLIPGGKTLDDFPIDYFAGKAILFDCRNEKKVTLQMVKNRLEPILEFPAFFLLYTGWNIKWGEEAYFKNFPVLTEEAAKWISGKGIRGIGTDAISVDPVEADQLQIHKIFLTRNCIILENLTNLNLLPESVFELFAIPLNIKYSDGSPARVFARIDEQ